MHWLIVDVASKLVLEATRRGRDPCSRVPACGASGLATEAPHVGPVDAAQKVHPWGFGRVGEGCGVGASEPQGRVGG